MGLFHKNRDDEEEHTDSGVREVLPPRPRNGHGQAPGNGNGNGNGSRPRPEGSQPRAQAYAPHHAHSNPQQQHDYATIAQSQPSPQPVPEPAAAASFGIGDAVALLKQIPHKDNEAVRKAVHKTLEVMQVDRTRLIEDAAQKDSLLESRIERLRAEVERHNALVLAATKEIAALESERTELASTKSWLIDECFEPISGPILLDRVSQSLPRR
jgi:hypothetical protein